MTIAEAAETVWRYHRLGHALAPADAAVVLGSHDTRVAERGAEVFLAGLAPLLVFSGNVGTITRGTFARPEAEVFAEVAERRGVPRERMLLETRSTNTGENVEFTRALLAERGVAVRRLIAVHKPYMERRTHATFAVRWPEVEVLVTSPQVDFASYCGTPAEPPDGAPADGGAWPRRVVEIMVGDLERLIVYGAKGWSAPQEVPPRVTDAFRRLVEAGYTGRLLPKIK